MGGVIHSRQASLATPFSFVDLERQGRELVARAAAQAREILARAEADARRRAAEIEQAAHAAGYEEGWQAAQEQVEREVRQAALEEGRRVAAEAARENVARLSETLTAAVAEWDRRKRSLLAASEAGLINLAVAIARRVCKIQLDASVAPVRENIRVLLDMVQHMEDVELHVNPAEYELLRDVAPETAQRLTTSTHVMLVADAEVPRGGCVLRTRTLVIDASIEQQLDRVAAAICAGSAGVARHDEPPGGGPTQGNQAENGA